MTVPTQHMKEVVAGEVVGRGDRNGSASRNFPQLTHVGGWDPGSPGSENGGSNHVSASTRYEVQCRPTMWPRSSAPDGGLLCICTCFYFTPPSCIRVSHGTHTHQRKVIWVNPHDAQVGVVGVVPGNLFQDLQELVAI